MAPVPNYIIGDPAHPLPPFCMKELHTCSSNAEVVFNKLLRSARNPVECAFARLKASWSILTWKMNLKLDNIPTVIYTCFVLHNFCEYHSTYVDNAPDTVYSCNISEGEVVRRMLIQYIKTNLPCYLKNKIQHYIHVQYMKKICSKYKCRCLIF